MSGHEADECSRPAERAIDPGLAGPFHQPEHVFVVGATDNILDDGATSRPFQSRGCAPLRLRGKVNPGGNPRSRLLRQVYGNTYYSHDRDPRRCLR
jgi:hypothetical protein